MPDRSFLLHREVADIEKRLRDDSFLAIPDGPRSRSKLPHFVAALRASIAIARGFLADASDDRMLVFYAGAYAGCMVTVAAAFVIARFGL